MQDLRDRIAFVTGGSSGIGLGIVKVLAAAGMKVAFSYRQDAHRDETLAYFRQHPDQRVHPIRLDVTDRNVELRGRERSGQSGVRIAVHE